MNSKFFLLTTLLTIAFVSIKAQDFDAKLNDAKIAMMEGNYEKGLSICEDLIALGTDDSVKMSLSYGYAGMGCEALGRQPDAVNYYYKAVSFQVPQLDIYTKLISLSKKEKNDTIYEFALLEKAKAFPDYQQSVTKSLAYHYVNTQQYEELLRVTDELLTWHPSNIKYLFFKGIALQQLDKIDEAKEYFKVVLDLDFNHPGANMSLGIMLFNSGREIFDFRKKEYEALAKPDRVDYSVYNKGIEKGKKLFRQALPYLLKAHESGSYPSIKRVLFNTYVLLEEKENAEHYR